MSGVCHYYRIVSSAVSIFDSHVNNALFTFVVTKQPRIDPKAKNLLDEGSDREEKERLRDLDNNVPSRGLL
jgi:hypothetical protein